MKLIKLLAISLLIILFYFPSPAMTDTSSVTKMDPDATTTTLSNDTTVPANNTIYNFTNLAGITAGPLRYSYPGAAVVFIEKNLTITHDITTNPTTPNAGLLFVVNGNIIIERTVTRIDAVLISGGRIYTAGDNCPTNSVTFPDTNTLTINGSLISLNQTESNAIRFCRNLGASNRNTPAEKIVFQPKYLVILNNLFSDTLQKWSDVSDGSSTVPTDCSFYSKNPSVCAQMNCTYDYKTEACQ